MAKWAATLGTLAAALVFATAASAATTNYTFTTLTNDSLTDMSAGTTQLLGPNLDDAASAVTNIGFDFYFQGTRFTQFSASSNGLVRLGGTVVQTAGPYKPLGQAGLPLITAYGADQRTHTTGRVHFRVLGSAPSRVLVVEWLNMQADFNGGGTADLTYQARLYETSGAIEFVYGSMAMSTPGAADANSRDPHFGFSSSNIAQTVGSVTAAQSGTPAPTYDGASATPVANLYTTGAITVLNSAANGSRRLFAFDPASVDFAPTGLNFTGTTPLSTTLNWNDNAATNEFGYAVYRSSDGGANFGFLTTTPPNAINVVDATLTPGTAYLYRVHAFSEGELSTPATGGVTSGASGNVASTAAGGLWSSPATWVGGAIPVASDLVTITDGSTVTIDTAAVAFTVTVGSGAGAPANLVYEAAVARSLTVGQNVVVSSNGVLQSAATGTVTTHSLVVNTDLTNNGTLDFSTNANTAGASITFQGAANNSFTGTGTITDIRAITIAKVANTNVLTHSPSNFTVLGVNTDSAGFLTLTSGTFRLAGTFTGTNRVFVGAAYAVPASAGFRLDNPNYTIAGQNGSPTVAGLLQMSQGTYNVGTGTGNSLGFAAGSRILVEGGAINTTGRFAVTAAANAITYNQTGGTITVCTIGNASTTLGSFDLGTGAGAVSINGGTIVVQLASTAATTPRDYRHQAGLTGTTTVTGGTLQMGNAGSGAAKTFSIAGVVPNFEISNTSAGHTVNFLAPVGFSNVTRNVLINPGTTLNPGNFAFLFNGTTLTNNGTLTHNGASSNFVWFNASAPMLYTGSGTVTTPMSNMAIQADMGLTFDPAVANIVTSATRLFSGSVTNSNKIIVGNGGVTTATVQIGNTTTPTAAGTFDQQLGFNPGTGGVVLSYLRTTNSRTTGFEVPVSRSLATLTYNDNDITHTLTLAGGDVTVATTLALTNGRIVTGANTLIAGAAAVTRTTGLVDGNLRKTIAAAGVRAFEVGTANGFSPVSFNVTAGTFPQPVTVSATQGVLGTMPTPALALNRFWTLNATGITADLTFTYLDPADLPLSGAEADMTVYRSAAGVATNLGGTVAVAANTATINGISTFSDWTLGGSSLQISPTTVNFGSVTVGNTTAPSTVTLTNTGSTSLDVTTLNAAGAPFARSGGSCSAIVPFAIAAGANCTLEYTYTPTATGASNQVLTVTSTSGNGTITLGGTGIQGALTIVPNTVAFGSVAVGSTTAPSTVTLSNTGSASLNVTVLDAAAAPFARSGGSCSGVPITIAAGTNCTLEYTYSPTAAGASNQTLTVTANAPGSGTIALGGTGLQGALTIVPNTVAFGSVTVGSTTAPSTVTLSNTGSASLDVTVLDAAAAPFARSGGSCGVVPITIAAGTNCTLEYTYSPTAAGASNQTLTVTANAPGSGTIALGGTGLQGALTIVPNTVAFGSVTVGSTTAPSTVTLSNTGSASLNVTVLDAAAAPFARSGGSCSVVPITIAAGTNCTLEYTYSPTATGAANQTLTVTANAPGSGTIALGGTGVQGVLTIAPNVQSFGNVQAGQTSGLGAIALGNSGNASLNVTALTLAAAPFVRTNDGTCGNTLPITIAQGTDCTITYRFQPTAAGAAQQTFTVTADAPGETTFELTGTGTPAPIPIFRDGFEN